MWALTGQVEPTRGKADVKGVINDACNQAKVTVEGMRQEGSDKAQPFKIVRTQSKTAPAHLTFELAGENKTGTLSLTKVQEVWK